MIPKIWCFFFGHKFFSDVFTGNYGQVYSFLTDGINQVPVMNKEQNKICPRCGKKL